MFNHEAEAAEGWMAKRESFLAGEEVGDSLDAVEALIKKHEDMDKSLQAQEEKIGALQGFADRLIQTRHYAAVEVAERRATVLARWSRLKSQLALWRGKLGQSLSFQQFKREADEAEAWVEVKMQVASEDSYKDPTDLPEKLQKHQAFEAEVVANKERIFSAIAMGETLRGNHECMGREEEVEEMTETLSTEWELLLERIRDKTQRLREANQQQQFNQCVSDLDFWLGGVEAQLSSTDTGRDLGGVQAMLKKQQLVEADIAAHQDRVADVNAQAERFVRENHFDVVSIGQKQERINQRYTQLRELAEERKLGLSRSLRLHQFYRDMDEEEAWTRERRLLMSGENFGRDLVGVQNLIKKHSRLGSELSSHQPRLEVVLAGGRELGEMMPSAAAAVSDRCAQMRQLWEELTSAARLRKEKLSQSLLYQRFCVEVDEEEAWLNEKTAFVSSEEAGDTLAAVQVLVKKHEAFEADLRTHQERVAMIEREGEKLVEEVRITDVCLCVRENTNIEPEKGNHQSDSINHRLAGAQAKVVELRQTSDKRRARLHDSSQYLQFTWKADLVESWIKNKEGHVRGEEVAKDMTSVQALLTKHEVFEAGLSSFQTDGIGGMTTMKDDLVSRPHPQSKAIEQRHGDVVKRWERLRRDSEAHKARLQRALEQCHKVEELYLQFARKASSFNGWMEGAEEDLTDPVRCNSLEEIKGLREAHALFQSSLAQARSDFKQLGALDRQIKSYSVSSNPYTWFTLEALEESWQNLQRLIKGTIGTILQRKEALRRMEDLGAQVEEALIFDNKYTEHTTVSLAQQWDQLSQSAMRMQHNLEQQIQARNTIGVSEEQLKEFTASFRHFDKDRNGRLEHQEFKSCLRSLGYDLALLESGETDPEFEAVLDQVDPNRNGYILLEDYMSFMISRETENVGSMTEVESAFQAITSGGDKPFVTEEELLQVKWNL
ncbi:Spectrin alpha chain, non-erythrocytic 1 [Geodia barretti]|uniref:Spectrin alpha chain, non-erythrocytic 1 n=1 Tax=Geodia barretti TaxID=519541 RepID=A0AA35RCL9_GEOBA|nr:Spectrin alpha chain, non-erythrocytic 1 [Geodia barretti]